MMNSRDRKRWYFKVILYTVHTQKSDFDTYTDYVADD